MSKKTEKFAIKPMYLALVLVLIILVTVVTIFQSRRVDNIEVTQTPSTLTEEKVDKDENGVYTNYKYGFKFEYPNDKFKMVHPDAISLRREWIYQVDENQYIQLNVFQLNEFFYDELYELKPGETMKVKHGVLTNLKSQDFGHAKLVVAKAEIFPSVETESASGYSAVWLRERDNSISLEIYDFLAKETEETKILFDQIVNSFEFINQ